MSIVLLIMETKAWHYAITTLLHPESVKEKDHVREVKCSLQDFQRIFPKAPACMKQLPDLSWPGEAALLFL